MISSLPSYWRGTVFRSRTEARWAVFFDAIKLLWEYEPEGFRLEDGRLYLPDFWLPEIEMWAEVKGLKPTDVEQSKVELLVTGTGHPCVILDGSPQPRLFEVCLPVNLPWGFEWLPACFNDKHTLCRHDRVPRLYFQPADHEVRDELVTAAMWTARRMDLKEPDAGDYLPAGWEGVEIVWDEPGEGFTEEELREIFGDDEGAA